MSRAFEELELSIDLETLDVPGFHSKNPIILSIGAVFFDPQAVWTPEHMREQNYKKFYSPVNLHQSLIKGFSFSESTLKFWEKQSYNMLEEAAACTEKLEQTFVRFADFCAQQTKLKRVWANSPSFDCSILRMAFDRVGMNFDIPYYVERDVRTIKDVLDDKTEFPSSYTKHNALDDACFEALLVQNANQSQKDNFTKLYNLEAQIFSLSAELDQAKLASQKGPTK